MKLTTGRALALTVGSAAVVVVAWLFGLPELSIFAVAVWTCSAATAALHRWRRAVPEVEARTDPPTVTRGDEAALRVHIVNRGGRRTVPVRLRGRFGTAGSGTVAVASLQPGESTTVAVALPTPARGLVRIGPLHIDHDDPLSIWHSATGVPSDASLLVRPRTHPLGDLLRGPGPRPGPGDRTAAVLGGAEADEDLVGLRPYVRGDDLRRIHWRTSARRNEPHVVQVEPPVLHTPVTILLDTRPTAAPAAFERAVEVAASIAVAASDVRRPMRLLTTSPGSRNSGSVEHNATLGELLDVLATTTRREGSDPTTILRSRTSGDASTIVGSGDPSIRTDQNLHRVADVVVCTAGTPAGSPVAAGSWTGGSAGRALRIDWDGNSTLASAWQIGSPSGQSVVAP